MDRNSIVEIRNVVFPDDIDAVKKLWFDYLVWGNDKMEELFGLHPHNPKEAVEQDIQQIDKFQRMKCKMVGVSSLMVAMPLNLTTWMPFSTG